jgi:2-C-methyl-D-erythritol 4-phosphate cytidylyltransferase
VIGALLLAAGSGSRMKGEVKDKLLQPIGGSNAFLLSCDAFLQSTPVGHLVILYKDATQLDKLQSALEEKLYCHSSKTKIHWVKGGQERQDSVWAGLCKLPDEVTHVLIHDCARPFIKSQTICEAADLIAQDKAVCVARPLKDTLRLRTDPSVHPMQPSPTQTINRENHWVMETPQGGPKKWLIEGLRQARESQISITDDIAALELNGHPVVMLEPNYPNPKITTPDDFSYATFLSQS